MSNSQNPYWNIKRDPLTDEEKAKLQQGFNELYDRCVSDPPDMKHYSVPVTIIGPLASVEEIVRLKELQYEESLNRMRDQLAEDMFGTRPGNANAG